MSISWISANFFSTADGVNPGAGSRRGPCSPSREFSFALHQIQQAIEPHLSIQQTLYSWNQIGQALAEDSRNRLLQLAKIACLVNIAPRLTELGRLQ